MTIRALGCLCSVLAGTAALAGSDRVGEMHPTFPFLASPELGTPAPRRALPFYYDLYTFRSDGGGTTVVAAIALQARRLKRVRVDGEVNYRFDVQFFLADTASLSVIPSIDSVFVSTPRALPRDHLLHTHIEVESPPSDVTQQRLVVTDASRPGVGQLYTGPFPIPDYSGDELMLSDIAFGLPDATTGWTRGGVTLALLPTSLFPESAFDVYYEIYNLPRGTPYETQISIESLDDSEGDAPVTTMFSGDSRADLGGFVAELRRVESAMPKGRYRLSVTVRNQLTNATASSAKVVEVRGWERGTTLVPALPRGR